jgi:hypothetical protein
VVDAPKNQLSLDDGDILTDESWEIARIWIHNGAGSAVWIAAWALDDAKSFGRLMADTVRHAARAYAHVYDGNENDMLQEIVDGLGEELREQFEEITTIRKGGLN